MPLFARILFYTRFRSRRSFARKYDKESNLNRYRKRISRILSIRKKYHPRIPTFHNICVVTLDPNILYSYLYSLVRGKKGETLDLEINNFVASNNVAAMLKSRFSSTLPLPPPPIGLSSPLPLLARVSLTGEPFRVYIGASRVSRLTNYVHTSAVA